MDQPVPPEQPPSPGPAAPVSTSALEQHAAVGWAQADLEMRVERGNPAFARLVGVAAEELPGLDLLALHADARQLPNLRGAFAAVARGEREACRMELCFEPEWGATTWVDLSASLRWTASGRPAGFCVVMLDISERKRREAIEVQRQALALQSAGLGLWEWQVPSGGVSFDLYWAMTLGYAVSELTPCVMAWRALVHPDDLALVDASRAPCLAGEQAEYRVEHRMRHKAGHWVWLIEQGMVTERDLEGRPVCVLGTSKEISERKQHEEDLQRALEAADAASRAKSGFLANMSHEIRTPMNAMIGLTRLVLDSGDLSLRQRDYLQKVHAAARSLLGILNDILDYSKIEAGHLSLEQVQFAIEEPLTSVAELFGAQVEQKGLELFFEIAPDMPMEVVGDPLRLTQVLNNLVSNAIKFTEKGRIHVKAEMMESGSEHLLLRFSVSDTGIGLSPDQISRLFQAFHQADNSITRKYGGTGLGLTISQQLVTMMGGQIGVKSVKGEGCTFTFTVRLAPASTQQLKMDLHSVRGLRALVVDDQEISQLIMRNLFEAWGVETETADSGEDGLKMIAQAREAARPFDVVLMDWRMPGMSGIDMARELRAQMDSPPFAVMVTSFGREQLVQQYGELPLDVVLTKPVVPSALFDILMQLRTPGGRRAVAAETAAHQPQSFAGTRLLLAEDNLLNQEVACEFLRGFGAEVTVASNGQEAVDAVAHERFDLVLMDMHMPVLGGVEATQRILGMPAGRHLPVVAMTAAVLSEDRAACKAAGMVDFVPKPVDPDDLLRVMRRWLPERAPEPSPGAAEPAPAPAKAAAPAELPTLDGFEPEPALRRLHGRRERLAQLLRSFAESHNGEAARLSELLERGDCAAAKRRLHTIKGTAGTLGLVAIADDARRLESALSLLDPAGPMPCGDDLPELAAIDRRVDELRAALDLPVSDGAADAPWLAEELRCLGELLAALRPYLSEHELVPDELMDELKRLMAKDLPGQPLQRLHRHLFEFDQAAAMSVLDTLKPWETPLMEAAA